MGNSPQEALAERDGLASVRRVIAHAAIRLGNDRDARADEKAKLDLARDELLVAGEELRARIRTLPVERRTPDLLEASEASKRLVATVLDDTSDDSWLATMLAYRGGVGAGMPR